MQKQSDSRGIKGTFLVAREIKTANEFEVHSAHTIS